MLVYRVQLLSKTINYSVAIPPSALKAQIRGEVHNLQSFYNFLMCNIAMSIDLLKMSLEPRRRE